MNEFVHLIENTGSWSISEFWFPVLIWTAFAALTMFVLHFSSKFNPLYHFHLRVAALLALPAGMLTILASSSLRDVFYAAPNNASGAFFVVQSPLEFTASASSTAETSAWLTPSFGAGILFIIAVGISLIMLIRFTISYFQLHRFRKNLPAIALSSLEQLSDQNRSLVGKINKRVTLAFGGDDFSPFTFGWKNPVIVIPQTFRDDTDKLNMIVGHELIHIRRGDYQLHLLQSFIQALFGFHPLVHIISAQAENYREISCDQEVLYETRISPKSYANLLVNLLPFSAKDVSPSIAMAVSNSNIKTRIKTMSTFKIHKTSYTRSFLFLLMLTIGMILPIACSDLQDSGSDFSVEAILDKQFTVQMNYLEINGIEVFNSEKSISNAYGQINSVILIPTKEYGTFAISPTKFPGAKKVGFFDNNVGDFTVNQMNVVVRSEDPIIAKYLSTGKPVRETEKVAHPTKVPLWAKHYSDVTLDKNGLLGITQSDKVDEFLKSKHFRFLSSQSAVEKTTTINRRKDLNELPKDVFVVVEEQPELIGGLRSIQSRIEYPELARRAGIEGRVIVQFIVDEQGNVVDPHILRGIGGGCDEAALEAVKQAKFEPGKQRGKAVRVQYALPITFELPK